MEAGPEACDAAHQVRLDGAQVVIVGEAVQVDQHLDPVTLVNKTRDKRLPRQLLVGPQLDPGGFEGVEFCVEEGLGDPDLENENSSKQGLLKIHCFVLDL